MRIWGDFSSQAEYKLVLEEINYACGRMGGMNMRPYDFNLKFIKGVIRSKL